MSPGSPCPECLIGILRLATYGLRQALVCVCCEGIWERPEDGGA